MTADEFLEYEGFTDFGEGYIISKEEMIEMLDEFAGQKKIDWEKLEQAYSNECTFRTPANSIMKPSKLFEWLKTKINEYLK